MKAYILTDADFERLLLRLGQAPAVIKTQAQQVADEEAKRRYNYYLRVWIGEVQK